MVDEYDTHIFNPSDVNLETATYVSFDLETSGLSSRSDEIIEIGAVKHKNGMIIDTFQTFINPHKKISKFTTDLTNITNDMLESGLELKEAMEAKQASQTTSLSEQLNEDEGNVPELYLGAADSNLDSVELKKDLKAAMEVLNEQQRQVIYYRYFEDLTQSKIAQMMGVSQMQVSRLEKSALEKIRGLMQVAED